jgi:ParB/RepB/Spo0J family partition protein
MARKKRANRTQPISSAPAAALARKTGSANVISDIPAFLDRRPKLTALRSIADIMIGDRHRRDMGDLGMLADSIAHVGLLQPVVVTPANLLIAGERRLRACRDILGWTEISVHVVDLDQIAKGEFAENCQRKAFTPSEIAAISKALMPVEAAAAKKRQSMAGGSAPGKLPEAVKPARAREKIAAFVGVSAKTLAKINAVVEAAETRPDKCGHLVTEMDRTGKVDAAYRQVRSSAPKLTETKATPVVSTRSDERVDLGLSTAQTDSSATAVAADEGQIDATKVPTHSAIRANLFKALDHFDRLPSVAVVAAVVRSRREDRSRVIPRLRQTVELLRALDEKLN